MRLLIVPICVLALAIAAVASAVTFAPRGASALTPTATPVGTPTVGPGQALFSFTFTNTGGSAADTVEITIANQVTFYDVTTLPGGCSAGTYSSSPGPNQVIGVPPPPGGTFVLPRTTHRIQWPSVCAAAGSTITVRFVGSSTDSILLTLLGGIAAPVGAFFNSATATSTPTFTPTATATMTASRVLVDCDVTAAGVQDSCIYPAGSAPIAVDVVLRWNQAPSSIDAFNFHVINSNDAAIIAPMGADTNMSANPDFNEAGPGAAGTWACNLPLPDNDNLGADNVADVPLSLSNAGYDASFLSCYESTGFGPAVLAGDLVLARVSYNVVGSGVSAITLTDLAIGDNAGVEIGSCAAANVTSITCEGASILIAPGPPTVTPTPTATATNTPFGSTSATPTNSPTGTPTTSGASVSKVPEGNANNVDLSASAANLWLCVTGPCAGPGEGNLIVFEYASNVLTGDFNGDNASDGLGAYEFDVEYDNFVIQSVNPSDIVFNPGPIAPYPGGADGVLDGEGAARAPSSCGFSLVFENVVHFGCVTTGQVPGPTGDFDLVRLNLVPHPDLTNDIFPGNDNGVVTVIKDNGCELVDTFGHPVAGSVGGGLTPVCGDLAVTVRILEGDLNLDCVVDIQDQQMIAWRYGSFFGSALYAQWYDLEPNLHDLDIDIKDIQKVYGRDGSTCQNPIQPQSPLPPPAPFGN